ncbi:hypothetical protein LAM23_23165, partial [Mycobacterium tuberculosis]|nr:hypothetical protein [Mycobacterium tuberculosis]
MPDPPAALREALSDAAAVRAAAGSTFAGRTAGGAFSRGTAGGRPRAGRTAVERFPHRTNDDAAGSPLR